MKQFSIALVIVVLLGGAYWLWQNNAQPGGNTQQMPGPSDMTSTGDTNTNTDAPASAMSATVTYDGKRFSPSEVTIKKGGTVKWMNASGGSMWVASATHPSHMVYAGTARQEHCPDTSGTAFDQCAGGGDYSFTFDKVGTWNYHDHINAQVYGKVIVVE